jgi:hypothetical protein
MLFSFDPEFLKPINAVDALGWTDLKDIIFSSLSILSSSEDGPLIFWKTISP